MNKVIVCAEQQWEWESEMYRLDLDERDNRKPEVQHKQAAVLQMAALMELDLASEMEVLNRKLDKEWKHQVQPSGGVRAEGLLTHFPHLEFLPGWNGVLQ
jgi:hypothetical protein